MSHLTPNNTIEVLAEQFGVSRQLLRFWEDEFNLQRADKSAPFTTEQADRLRVAHYLIKERGLTLEETRDALERESSSILSRLRTIEKLQELQTQMDELLKQL